MYFLIPKKLILPLLLVLGLSVPVFFAQENAGAAKRSDCNGDFISDRDKCKEAFDDCKGKTKCEDRVVYTIYRVEGAGQEGDYWCGNIRKSDGTFDGSRNVKTKFNFGCLGKRAPPDLGPIQDLVFALIRFASVGVGIVIVISLILAGIQYSTAEGNPESAQKAKLRVQNTVIALAIYIFAFSILQFLIPGGLFKP